MKLDTSIALSALFCVVMGFWSESKAEDYASFSPESPKISVVCTFTILADFVRNIGGETVQVESMVGFNSDPHVFSPTPESVKSLSKADLVFVNGLGFEGWMDRLIEASGYKREIIVATKGMKDVSTVLDDKSKQILDPHTWLTINQAFVYLKNIREALIKHRPHLKTFFEKNYLSYTKQLKELEKEIQVQISQVPPQKRKVITAHDAFNYFEKVYGIKFYAPQGITTESEPSAKAVAKLINRIKQEKIKAVFVENISNERLLRQIAQETGVQIRGTLYTDALSDPSGSAPTYIHLMRHNTSLMVKAMKLNGSSSPQ